MKTVITKIIVLTMIIVGILNSYLTGWGLVC